MEGKEGILVFYKKSEDGFMQGCVCVCMCFIVEIKSDSNRLEDLGTARQLTSGLQLHIPSFLSLKGKKIPNLNTTFQFLSQ